MRIGKFKDVIMIRLWLRKTLGRYRSINMFPFAPRALCNTLWDCENALNKSAASAVWKMINVTPNIMFWSDCIKHTMNLALKLHKSRTRRCLTSKRIYPNYGLHLHWPDLAVCPLDVSVRVWRDHLKLPIISHRIWGQAGQSLSWHIFLIRIRNFLTCDTFSRLNSQHKDTETSGHLHLVSS